MDRVFTLATQPPEHRCIGIALEPLTLGHVFLLYKLGSPLINGDAASVEDVGLAVSICSQDWKSSEKDIRKWWFKLYLEFLALRLAGMDLKKEMDAFWAYFSESLCRPFVKTTSNEHWEMMGTPWFWSLFAFLRVRCHMSEDEAMRYPIVRASAIKAAIDESENRIRLTSQEDEELIAAMEEARKKFAGGAQ